MIGNKNNFNFVRNAEPNIYKGLLPIVFPANTQYHIAITAKDELLIKVNENEVLLTAGDFIVFEDKNLLNKQIEIVNSYNVEYIISAIGKKMQPIEPTYNFDISTNQWDTIFDSPIVDANTLANFLASYSYLDYNNLTEIVINDFVREGNRIRCNLFATGSIFDLSGMGITSVLGFGEIDKLTNLYLSENLLTSFEVPLPNSLKALDLSSNNLTNFELTIPDSGELVRLYLQSNSLSNFNITNKLRSNMQLLFLYNNLFDYSSYEAMESWAIEQPIFTDLEIYIYNNLDSIEGTQLNSILNTKNVTVIFEE